MPIPTAVYVGVGVGVLLALEAGAEWLLTLWSRHATSVLPLLGGVGLYALVGLVFALLLKWGNGNLAATNALWQASNIAVVTLVGVLAFGDSLSAVEWIGVALAFLAALCFVVKAA